jgi:hypothetical protein
MTELVCSCDESKESSFSFNQSEKHKTSSDCQKRGLMHCTDVDTHQYDSSSCMCRIQNNPGTTLQQPEMMHETVQDCK